MHKDFLAMLARSASRADPPDRPLSAEEAEGVAYALREREAGVRGLWEDLRECAEEIEIAVGDVGPFFHALRTDEARGFAGEVAMTFAYADRLAVFRVGSAPEEVPALRALLTGVFAAGTIALGSADSLSGSLTLHLVVSEEGGAKWATLQEEEHTLLSEAQLQRMFEWLVLGEAKGV